jgi:hypothetical protein
MTISNGSLPLIRALGIRSSGHSQYSCDENVMEQGIAGVIRFPGSLSYEQIQKALARIAPNGIVEITYIDRSPEARFPFHYAQIRLKKREQNEYMSLGSLGFSSWDGIVAVREWQPSPGYKIFDTGAVEIGQVPIEGWTPEIDTWP